MQFSRPKEIYSIQYLRAVAASLVVLHHVFWQYNNFGPQTIGDAYRKVGAIGAGGVDIFFLISGFIIFYTMKDETGSKYSRRFMADRFFRVIPIYWIWTTALIAIALTGLAANFLKIDTLTILSSYTLIPTITAKAPRTPSLIRAGRCPTKCIFTLSRQ